MYIREYQDKDFDIVSEFIGKHEIAMPEYGVMFIEFSDDDKILALASMRNVTFIEPLVSENPMAGARVIQKIEEYLKLKRIKKARCFTNPKNEALFTKAGFKTILSGMITMEKNYG